MKIAKRYLPNLRDLVREERGLGLVETLVAVGILGVAIVAFVAGLSTGSIAVRQAEGQVVAESLARSQLEYIKAQPYNPEAMTYPPVEAPNNYSISVEVGSIPGGSADIQRITVAILRSGESILTVEDYKVNR